MNLDVYYKASPNYNDWILITDKRFLNNERYLKDLYGAKSDTKPEIVSNINKDSGLRFPKIWQANGTIQKIPESNVK